MRVMPIAAWPDHGNQRVMCMANDGQLYALQMLGGGTLVATEWVKIGPPVPHTSSWQWPLPQADGG